MIYPSWRYDSTSARICRMPKDQKIFWAIVAVIALFVGGYMLINEELDRARDIKLDALDSD